jgi:hypothetical protein
LKRETDRSVRHKWKIFPSPGYRPVSFEKRELNNLLEKGRKKNGLSTKREK